MRITNRNLRRMIREAYDPIGPRSVPVKYRALLRSLIDGCVAAARQDPGYSEAKRARDEFAIRIRVVQDDQLLQSLEDARENWIFETGESQRVMSFATALVKIIFKILPPDRIDIADSGLTSLEWDTEQITSWVSRLIVRESLRSDYSADEIAGDILNKLDIWTDRPGVLGESSERPTRKGTAGSPTLNIDGYKPVIRKLLISAVEDVQEMLGEEAMDQFVSRYSNGGQNSWRVAVELGDIISESPPKSASAIVTVINSIALRSGTMMSGMLGVDVPDDDRSRPEENTNSIVANLSLKLLDPSSSLDEFTVVDESACALLTYSFNWTIFFASNFIRSEASEILSGDPARANPRLDSLRSLMRDVAGLFNFTNPHTGNKDLEDYCAHWLKVVTRTVDEMVIRKSREMR